MTAHAVRRSAHREMPAALRHGSELSDYQRPPRSRVAGSRRRRTENAEHTSHPGVDAAVERVRARLEARRGAPLDAADAGPPDPQLAGVEVARSIGERIRDPVVQAARALARGDGVEHRGQVLSVGRRAGRPARFLSSFCRLARLRWRPSHRPARPDLPCGGGSCPSLQRAPWLVLAAACLRPRGRVDRVHAVRGRCEPLALGGGL